MSEDKKNPIAWTGLLNLFDLTVPVFGIYLFGNYYALLGLGSGKIHCTEHIGTELSLHELRNPNSCTLMCIEGEPERPISNGDNFVFREMEARITDSGFYGFKLSNHVSVYVKNERISRILSLVCPDAFEKYGRFNYMLMVVSM